MSSSEFRNLVMTNESCLKPYAFRLTKDGEAAKDLYQETITRALVNADKYRQSTNIRAWLYTIMKNIFINGYRRDQHKKLIDQTYEADLNSVKSNRVFGDMAEARIREKYILKQISSLPPLFRSPFLLYFNGYKYHEIASAYNEPLGTIKSRIHFARKLLKAKIQFE